MLFTMIVKMAKITLFGEDDLDELIIKRPDVPENNIAPAAVQQQEQC